MSNAIRAIKSFDDTITLECCECGETFNQNDGCYLSIENANDFGVDFNECQLYSITEQKLIDLMKANKQSQFNPSVTQ